MPYWANWRKEKTIISKSHGLTSLKAPPLADNFNISLASHQLTADTKPFETSHYRVAKPLTNVFQLIVSKSAYHRFQALILSFIKLYFKHTCTWWKQLCSSFSVVYFFQMQIGKLILLKRNNPLSQNINLSWLIFRAQTGAAPVSVCIKKYLTTAASLNTPLTILY